MGDTMTANNKSVSTSALDIDSTLSNTKKVIDQDGNDIKHIQEVRETDDAFIIQFGKAGMEAKPGDHDREEAGHYDDDEDEKNISVPVELKMDPNNSTEQYGVFEGYGSMFGNTDLGNDVIEKGAFRESLMNRPPEKVKLLYQHKSDMPIGVFDEIREDENGLYVKGRLALKTKAGAEAYELLKMGALDGLSIGFKTDPKNVSYEERGKVRRIKKVDLMEVSLVTFPMNPKATVRLVKGEDISIREWEKGLRDAFQLSRSEAKLCAKALEDCFDQREADPTSELVDAIKNLTLTIKTS